MTVVAADGQPVHPVTVDELRIAPAETFDVIVEPSGERRVHDLRAGDGSQRICARDAYGARRARSTGASHSLALDPDHGRHGTCRARWARRDRVM